MPGTIPKSPPDFKEDDIKGTVNSVVVYLKYLYENLDYLIGQLDKADKAADFNIANLQRTVANIEAFLMQL